MGDQDKVQTSFRMDKEISRRLKAKAALEGQSLQDLFERFVNRDAPSQYRPKYATFWAF